MAQPTGCELTELHAEEETTPREVATPRRASSRDSETTIVESVFATLDHSRLANVTKKQLVDELRARGLRCSGRMDELIARIIRDNITREALEPTDSSTKDQAAYDDDRQAHLETLSADNARLCAELSSLRAQLNLATTSERETLHEAHQNASLPTERVTTPTLGLHHSVPADTTMSSRSTRPPSLNDGTNQDAARPAAPTVSTHEGEPSMAQILAALVNTQALLTNTLSRGPPTTSLIEIHSTSDTSSSIPLFDETPQQSTHEWITQVERITALAHWTPSLTLVTAASRLTGSAKDWHSAYGSQYDTWEQWKEALVLRFKRKLTGVPRTADEATPSEPRDHRRVDVLEERHSEQGAIPLLSTRRATTGGSGGFAISSDLPLNLNNWWQRWYPQQLDGKRLDVSLEDGE
ncbi:hypothetical protein HPB51_027199 [Rhipicephalus microplus]|uniref:SAP domain-containing protein n=1 Tax=Rhipicephalus microplus TaxID=6941 RepID=A0A9J6D165_RHIMP|nr:hypothetical protein HPB51_027199 [Rhipicephalus microplus]